MDNRLQLRQFLLFVFVLLIPSFALWTAASGPLAIPGIGLVNKMLTGWFPHIVQGLFVDGSDGLLMTRFAHINGALVPATAADSLLGFRIDSRILTYSIPFYTALYFATPGQRQPGNYFWGLLILYPLYVFGLLSLCLKELAVNLGSTFLDQPDTFVPHANVIIILYQLNVLLVPTLAPAALWAWQSRDSELLRGVLGKLAKSKGADTASSS